MVEANCKFMKSEMEVDSKKTKNPEKKLPSVVPKLKLESVSNIF